jgi:diguanylate cyclase (GGDEF)-like protein
VNRGDQADETRPPLGNRWLILFCLVLSAGLLISFHFLFIRDLRDREAEISGIGTRIHVLLEHEITMKTFTIRTIRGMAEQYLERIGTAAMDPSEYLVKTEEGNGYTLSVPLGFSEGEIGNITGLGRIPEPGSDLAREMAMAVHLTPMFMSTMEHSPETPWIYYTSLRGFIYLYPRVPPEEFFFSEKLYELDFVRGALPDVNPGRAVFWSPVYLDEAGKGYMTTVSAPVYQDDVLRGSLSIDISIAQIDWMLRRYSVPCSSVHIMYTGGMELLGTGGAPPAVDPALLPVGVLTAEGRFFLTPFPLSIEGWFLVIQTEKSALFHGTILRNLPLMLMLFFLCAGILLVTLLFSALARVRHLSTTDELTGLLNRRVFQQTMEEEFARAHRQSTSFGLIILDIDYFKKYNDTYGHHEGDMALRKTGTTIRETLERTTDKAFRVGGEEFVVLTLVRSREKLLEVMERIRTRIEGLGIAHSGSEIGHLTVSLGGVLVVGTRNTEFDAAYRSADESLYKSKARGRNVSTIADLDRDGPARYDAAWT